MSMKNVQNIYDKKCEQCVSNYVAELDGAYIT